MDKLFDSIKNNKLSSTTLALSLLFTFLGLPSQILRILQTQSVQDISLPLFVLLDIQSVFWIMHGVRRRDWAVAIANSSVVLFSTIIVILYFIFMR